MKTLDEQYNIQYKKIKDYWKKKRRKRALIYFIMTAAIIIFALIFQNNEYYTLFKIPIVVGIICTITCTLRELLIPLNEEKRELKELNYIYEKERFKERNG